MVKLFIPILAVFAVLTIARGKNTESCVRRIERFERCLEKGYKSKAGCVSGDGKLKGPWIWRRCRKLEKKIAKKCDYVCEKPQQPEEPEEPAQPEEPEEPLPEGCERKDSILVGVELKSLQPSTFEDCKVECSSNPDCAGFNFYFKPEWSQDPAERDLECELLADITGIDWNERANSMIKGCDRSELDMSCLEEGTDFIPINDNREQLLLGDPILVERIEDCATTCRDINGCMAMSFEHDYKDCVLWKDAPGLPGSEMTKEVDKWYHSMVMDCNTI